MSSISRSSSLERDFPSDQPRQRLSSEDYLSSSASASPAVTTSGPRSNLISSGLVPSEHSTPTNEGADFSEEDQDPSSDARERLPAERVIQDDRGVLSSIYLKQIGAERDLTTSLDALTAQDLSVHSFNAFASKRRARIELEASRLDPEFYGPNNLGDAKGQTEVADEDDEVSDKSITYEQVGDLGWQPPKVWTAWPMRPEYVPQDLKNWEEDDTFESLRSHDQDRPSAILSDLLVGIVLKLAKERLRAKGVLEVKKPPSPSSTQRSKDNSISSSGPDVGEDMSVEREEVDTKPVMMADDERASSILQPSVNGILRNLDKLFTNLNHARASYAIPRRREPPTDLHGVASELSTSNAETSAASSRRKRRRPNLRSTSRPEPIDRTLYDVSSQSEDPSHNIRSRKRQRTTSPTRSASRAKSTPRSHQQGRAISRKSSRSPRPPRKRTFGLLDWSNVLGMASLSNFPQQAVLRASERCADLFGEGMSFRVLHEDARDAKDAEIDVLPDTRRLNTVGAPTESADEGDELSQTSALSPFPQKNDRRNAMHGGVHIDNFLQPIQGKVWWRPDYNKRKKKPKPTSSQASETERDDLERLLVKYRAQEDLSWPQIADKVNEELDSSYSVGALRNRFQRRRGGIGGERRRSRRLSGFGLDAEIDGEGEEEGMKGGDGDGSASESEEEGQSRGDDEQGSDEIQSDDEGEEVLSEEDSEIDYRSASASKGEPQKRRETKGMGRGSETGTQDDAEGEGDDHSETATENDDYKGVAEDEADIEKGTEAAIADDAMSLEL